MSNMNRWFVSEHLPPHLRSVVRIFQDALDKLDSEIVLSSAEHSAGMRKLLEAKDCFVRAMILQYEIQPPLKQ